MEEKTADEIATIFTTAGDSVTVIGTAQASDETDEEFKAKIQRNVEHLEIIKAYKKLDDTTSIWTSEDFTAIDAAIVAGKKLYLNLQERLQQLAQQREQLWIALHETNGAMKLLEQQILETQAAPELAQPSDTKASSQELKTESLKSKA